MNLVDHFVLCHAAVTGREHVLVYAGSQDSSAGVLFDDFAFGVVADGCGESPNSQVGASLAAEWLAGNASRYFCLKTDHIQHDVVRFIDDLVDFIHKIVLGSMDRGAGCETITRAVHDRFLFTFLAFAVTRNTTVIFGMGDGVYEINGNLTILDSGETNEPTYPMYRIVPTSLLRSDPGCLQPTIHFVGPTSEIETLLVGTDGLAAVEARRDLSLKRLRACRFCKARMPDDGGEFLVVDRASVGYRYCLQCGGAIAEHAPAFEDAPARVGPIRQFTDPRDGLASNPGALQRRLNVLGPVNHHLDDDATLVVLSRRP